MGPDKFDMLLARARTEGSVLVIVRLCVPFRPEGELADDAAVRSQRAAIAGAQNALLKELSTRGVGSVKKSEYTPFISMAVDANALLRLKSSAEVADITEDAIVPAAAQE
jgi:hypothetical protein